MDQNTRVKIITISRIVAAFVFLCISVGVLCAIFFIPTSATQHEECKQVFKVVPDLGSYTVVAIVAGFASVFCLFTPDWGD